MTKLFFVIPCYNEENVLHSTFDLFNNKLDSLIKKDLIASDSKILYVNDGSTDKTWEIIKNFVDKNDRVAAISLNKNRGHQNALLAGLMTAKEYADIVISIDCDGQDDINVSEDMIKCYNEGYDIVYGVRKERKTDSFFKRTTALFFYKLCNALGAESVYNHADYRLMSKRALNELEKYDEANLYLRGTIPMLGFKSKIVYYDREARKGGNSHYSIFNMLALAINGITNLSIKPIRIIFFAGLFIAVLCVIFIIYAIYRFFTGNTIGGWASIVCALSFLSAVQLISIGIIGEYIGKIYIEVKHRPKYCISEIIGI